MSAAVLTIPASSGEVLSIDWNKYRPLTLASGGVDKVVNVWDCRMIKPGELNQVGGARETQLFGHEYAVRKVQWSPHRAEVLATASYDMTCRVFVAFFALGKSHTEDRIELSTGGIQLLPLVERSCCTFMTLILSLLLAVDGHSMRKVSWQAVDGTVD